MEYRVLFLGKKVKAGIPGRRESTNRGRDRCVKECKDPKELKRTFESSLISVPVVNFG